MADQPSTTGKDMFAHADGTGHAPNRALGCPRCAAMRTAIWPKLSKAEQVSTHTDAFMHAQMLRRIRRAG